MPETLMASLNGITDLPAGHVATIKTYLSMPARPVSPNRSQPEGFRLERLAGAQWHRYRTIFARLGHRWLWWSRLEISRAALADILDEPAVEAYAVVFGGSDIGLIELDFRTAPTADLAFLGLFEGHTGKGIGASLMGEALDRLWRPGIREVTVNTCTFDHPAALGFYRRHGFLPIRQAIEIVPDPRLSGVLPLDAAQHVPLQPAVQGP